jgi:hypothetical protein
MRLPTFFLLQPLYNYLEMASEEALSQYKLLETDRAFIFGLYTAGWSGGRISEHTGFTRRTVNYTIQ